MSDIAGLLERFRRAPEVLAMVLTGVFGEEIDFLPAPGKWSIRFVIAHLADSEIVGTQRFRQVIAEEKPTLGAYDQNAWAENLDYARRLPKNSLESFRRIRAENYELLKGLPESAFARIGMHAERGPLTLERLLEMYTEHTESHASQMQALRDEYKKSKGK
jgi:hypothetical protein